jgi:hypothetical protein
MTNDPRDPRGGQQPGMPEENFGSDSGQSAGSAQGAGSGQQPGRGSTPTSGASSGARSGPSGSSSEERAYEAPQETTRTTTGTQTYQTPQASRQAAPPRTYDAPRESRKGKLIALAGILGLVALGGIIAGFAASHSSPTVPAAIRPIPTHHAAARHAAASRGHLVASVSGTGVRYSAPFKVTNSAVTTTYSYRCTSGSHPFVAALAQSRTNITPITNTTGTGASHTVTVHPTSVGSLYRVAASSPCPYHVSVFQR